MGNSARHALWFALDTLDEPVSRSDLLACAVEDAAEDVDRDQLGRMLDTLERQGEVYRVEAGYRMTDR